MGYRHSKKPYLTVFSAHDIFKKIVNYEWSMIIVIEETVKIKLYFKDGRTVNTMFRGSYKEATKHWLGNTFNLNYGIVDIQECVQISKLN